MNRALAAVLSLSLAPLAFAGESEKIYLTDPGFAQVVSGSFLPLQAKDAFAGLGDCGVLENKRRYSLVDAVAAVQPCLNAVTARYGLALKAEPGRVEDSGSFGIVIYAGNVSVAAPVMRDLNHAIAARGGELLGHTALLRREAERQILKTSLAQEALDSCLLPAVLRKVETAQDFITHYGSCLTMDAKLQVKEMRQSPGHTLGVALVTAADEIVAEGLNGVVAVMAESGRVELMIMAYPEKIMLP